MLLSAGIGATPVLAMLHAWRPAGPRARFGGCTAREMRPGIPLPARRSASPPRFRASEDSSLTATRTRRSARRGLRRARTPEPQGASAAGCAEPGRLLSVWPAGVPSQLYAGSHELGCRERAITPGGIRSRAIGDARHLQGSCPGPIRLRESRAPARSSPSRAADSMCRGARIP